MPLTPGSTFGRYQVLSVLGTGGMGEVFLARDTLLDRRVALKQLRDRDGVAPDRIQRFLQEARAASALTHPHIAVVYDVGEVDGDPFIAMEYVDGRALADQLRGGPLSIREVVTAGSQIAEALQSAHAIGVVHRDIKPANVMITTVGQVKVLDFGLATFVASPSIGASDETQLAMTAENVVLGTTAYMSPEQSIGAAVDNRSDLFSLGVLLYEAATGRLPFTGATTFAMIDRIRHGEPDAMTAIKADVPEELARIVGKCLAKEPARRYQSAGELLTDLRILARHSDAAHAPLLSDRPSHNMPPVLTTFVGRRQEVEHVTALLAGSRLVTLAGAGGSGKTRLAQQIGSQIADAFAHGSWFVDLAPTSNPDLVASVVARALDVPEKPGATIEWTLLEWLRSRQLLIILDNCEHLVDACATFAESMLRHAPSLRVLATSREALNVPGEVVWRVPPLALPPASEALGADRMIAFDAIRLFADRAAAVTPFHLTDDNVAIVADVCRRLDGVPLAIELAAARVKVLSVAQIRDRLHDRFRLLAGGGRTVVARQRTLEATVAWSYDLLSEVERRLLARLSIFAGGWTLDAAEQVGGGEGIEESDVLDLLSRLVDKSLVIVEDNAGDPRYRLLETIRQYGRERLLQSGELASRAQSHLDHFLRFARDVEPRLIGPEQAAWLNRVEVEHDNLRSAMEWALADVTRAADGLAIATCLWWFWTKRGYFTEGEQRLHQALAAQPTVSVDIELAALIGLVHLTNFRGDWNASRQFIDRTLASARAADDLWAEAYALDHLALVEAEMGELARCAALARQARELALASRSRRAWQPLALANRLIAYDAFQNNRLDEAGRCFEEVIALLRAHGDAWSIGILLTDLAGLRVFEGRLDEARTCATEAMSVLLALRDRRGLGWCLQTIAMLEAAAGRFHRAGWLYGAGEAMLHSIGAAGQLVVTQVQERYLAPVREALGDAAFQAAANEGRAASFAQVMDMAPAAFAAS